MEDARTTAILNDDGTWHWFDGGNYMGGLSCAEFVPKGAQRLPEPTKEVGERVTEAARALLAYADEKGWTGAQEEPVFANLRTALASTLPERCPMCGSDTRAYDRIVLDPDDRMRRETVYRTHASLANPCPDPWHTPPEQGEPKELDVVALDGTILDFHGDSATVEVNFSDGSGEIIEVPRSELKVTWRAHTDPPQEEESK